jgi:hypothetical protein
MLRFAMSAPVGLSDLAEAGFAPPVDLLWDGSAQYIVAPHGQDAVIVAQMQAFATTPTLGKRRAASDRWVAAQARYAALPPVADPDPYAVMRSRLAAEVADALAAAELLGGVI